jgi:hypothetical protein
VMREIGRIMHGIRRHHETIGFPAPAFVYTVESRAEAERLFGAYVNDETFLDPETGKRTNPPAFPIDRNVVRFRYYGETIIIQIKEPS